MQKEFKEEIAKFCITIFVWRRDVAEQNIKKIKLLKLMELLREETDEQNPMVAKDVCKRLADKGVIVDRRVRRT